MIFDESVSHSFWSVFLVLYCIFLFGIFILYALRKSHISCVKIQRKMFVLHGRTVFSLQVFLSLPQRVILMGVFLDVGSSLNQSVLTLGENERIYNEYGVRVVPFSECIFSILDL